MGSDWKNTSALVRKTTESRNIDAGLNFVFSDESEDHYGDVIRAKGWRYTKFAEGNPICLFNHDKGFIVGRWENVRVEGNKLKGRLHLAPQGSSPRIDEVRALCAAGILKSCSVGFRPIRSKPRDNGGTEYLEQELLECSIVAVGANPSALLEAKRLGVSNEVIKMIFRSQTKNATIAERIAASKRAVKHYDRAEKAAVMRRAKEMLAKSKPQKLLPLMSPAQKARAEQDEYNREVHRRAKERSKKYQEEKAEAKRLFNEAIQDEPRQKRESFVTWRGVRIPLNKKWLGEDTE